MQQFGGLEASPWTVSIGISRLPLIREAPVSPCAREVLWYVSIQPDLSPRRRRTTEEDIDDISKLALAICLSIAAGTLALGTVAHADKLKNITCEQFLAMDEGARNNIVYWVHGVQVADSKKNVAAEEVDVGYDAFGRPVAEVVTACEGDKKASLWDKIKAHF